jgi:hypothetical protein
LTSASISRWTHGCSLKLSKFSWIIRIILFRLFTSKFTKASFEDYFSCEYISHLRGGITLVHFSTLCSTFSDTTLLKHGSLLFSFCIQIKWKQTKTIERVSTKYWKVLRRAEVWLFLLHFLHLFFAFLSKLNILQNNSMNNHQYDINSNSSFLSITVR